MKAGEVIFSIFVRLKIAYATRMDNKKWMFYLAYAVLVISAGVTLILSERPLSATVVAWALFSFNTATLVFLIPAVFGFISQNRNGASAAAEANTCLLNEIKEIKTRLNANVLIGGGEKTTNVSSDIATEPLPDKIGVPLARALAQTAGQPPQSVVPVCRQSPMPVPHLLPSTPKTAVGLVEIDNIFPKSAPKNSVPPSQVPVVQVNTDNSMGSVTPPFPQQASLFDNTLPPPQGQIVQDLEPDEQAKAAVKETPVDQEPAEVACGTAVLAAIAAIGEDDVLCLRGEGAGLDWQEGVPMTYDGSDRWRYRVENITAPITCRIYLNDEISAFGDDLILQPNQTLAVSPTFPKIEV